MAAPHLLALTRRLKRSLGRDRGGQQFVGDDEADRLLDRARREPWDPCRRTFHGSRPEPACRSVVELALHQMLRDAHKKEFTAALDNVLAITDDEELRERATRYKAGRTWDRARKNRSEPPA